MPPEVCHPRSQVIAVNVPRLRRVDCSGPGISRRRRGTGFEYRDEAGELIRDPEIRDRIEALAIPPAWQDVWICPSPMGHIQATGTDAAGRKQYRYHDKWRERRDAEKFESMVAFAQALPALRARVARDLAATSSGRERVLACAARLLDAGFFRVGSEGYAEENETYGLATIRRSHVTLDGGAIASTTRPRAAARRVQRIVDAEAIAVVTALKRRRGGGDELLAYKRAPALGGREVRRT